MNEKILEIAGRYAEECYEDNVALLRVLGRIPAPSHQEDQRVAFVKKWFEDAGVKDVYVDDAKNVVCRFGPMDGDLVVFEAHTDVVQPDLTPYPMKEEDGKLYAPGIGDDTANLTNLMMCIKYIVDNQLVPKDYGMLLVANSCEEGLGNLDGTKQLFKDYAGRIKYFYSFDGGLGGNTDGALGSYRYRITARTSGGHSSGDFGRFNAIEILARMIEKFYRQELPTEKRVTYNVGVIEGGNTVNSIAQTAEMLYEFRSESQNCLKIMQNQLDAIVEETRRELEAEFELKKDKPAAYNGVQEILPEITVEVIGIRPGVGDIDMDALNAFTEHNNEIIKACTGVEKVSVGAGSTDANIPLSIGVIANTMGTCHGVGAHSRDEYVYLDSLKPGCKLAMALILEYFM